MLLARPDTVSAETDSERRRGLRLRQQRPVKIYEPTVSRYFGGQTRDVSPSGLRLELPASVPVHAGRVINIHLGHSHGGQSITPHRQMLPARIVWVNRRDVSGGKMTVGIEFVAQAAAAMDAA